MNQSGKLETQKDGRLFAIELLQNVAALHVIGAKRIQWSAWNARTETECEYGVMSINRKGPQSAILKDAFDVLYSATEEARRGFFTVFTDYLGCFMCGGYEKEPREYLKAERAGEIAEWGSVHFRNPKKAAAKIKAAEKNAERAEPDYKFRPLTIAERAEISASRRKTADRKRLAKRAEVLKEKAREISRVREEINFVLNNPDVQRPGGVGALLRG